MNVVKSKYIKNLVKGKSFKDRKLRERVDDLIFLERAILGDVYGIGGAYKCGSLKNKRRSDYLELCIELDPKLYKEELEGERLSKLDEKELEKQEKLERKQDLQEEKELWKSMGGTN